MDKHDHSTKIGLLGGSFNPAHEGHVEISLAALDILALDQIWWMVSPGNPLKSEYDMATYEERFASAQTMASDPRISVSDIEVKLGTKYTIDTLEKIKVKNPSDHFIWLMGADNLVQFDQWKNWRKIADTVPFAIFNRPSYSKQCLKSVAAKTLEAFRVPMEQSHSLYSLKPPAWIFYELSDNPLSSTKIRSQTK